MRIEAISSAMPVMPCQPIKPNYSKQSFTSTKAVDTSPSDCFDSQNSLAEQKFDFACRLAAYYKTQYEQLLKNGGVVV